MLLAATALLTAASPVPIELPGRALHPESVAITSDGTAYVTGMTGAVLRVSLKTGVVETWLRPGTFGGGPLFGAFVDGRRQWLWTCSNDFSAYGVTVAGADTGSHAKAFDLATGQGKISLRLPGDKPTCNDFAVAKDGTVYVTDTATSNIYRWREGQAQLEPWFHDAALDGQGRPGGLDGIAFDRSGALFLNNYRSGELFRIDVREGRAAKLTKLALSRPLVLPDGMRAIGPGTLIVAEGEGRIARITVRGDAATVEILASGIAQPTGVDAFGRTGWYVQGQLTSLFAGGKRGAPQLPFRLTPVALEGKVKR